MCGSCAHRGSALGKGSALDLRRAVPWLLASGLALLLGTTSWAWALAFVAVVPLAIIAAVPRRGLSVWRRLGWTRLPLIGGLSGIKATGVLGGAAIAMLVI